MKIRSDMDEGQSSFLKEGSNSEIIRMFEKEERDNEKLRSKKKLI